MAANAPSPTFGKVADDSVKHLHLVDALRSHDATAIADAVRNLPPITPTSPTPAYGSPLQLAISLCSTTVIERLVASFPDLIPTWINSRAMPGGETPLHVAARLGRADVVEVLFKMRDVNDTVRDAHGRTADEVAKTERVAQLILAHRTQFANSTVSKVRHNVLKWSTKAVMETFQKSPRAEAYLSMGWIDINGPIDSDKELSLLHFAAQADDIELVEWALRHGADPGVKDRKGKKPVDLCPKHGSRTKDRLKRAIAQAPIMSGSLPQATSSTAGAPNAAAAPSQRGTLFKWTNYAVGYKPRYFVLEHGIFSYYKTVTEYPLACRGSISTMIASVSLPDPTDKSRFDVIGRGGVLYSLKARSPADAKKWVWALMESKKFMVDRAKEDGASARTSLEDLRRNVNWSDANNDGDDDDDKTGDEKEGRLSTGFRAYPPAIAVLPEGEGDASGILAHMQTSGGDDVLEKSFDQGKNLHTVADLLQVQLDAQQKVVQSLLTALGDSKKESAHPALGNLDVEELSSLIQSSSKHINEIVTSLLQRTESREKMWTRRWKRERDDRIRWQDVVQKILGDEALAAGHQPASLAVPSGLGSDNASMLSSVAADTDEEYEDPAEERDVFFDAEDDISGMTNYESMSRRGSRHPNAANLAASSNGTAATLSRTSQALSTVLPHAPTTVSSISKSLEKSNYGYPATYRTLLPLDPSKPKPSLAIWSFLRSAIGKDLTKITLPVFFNEPLSMLQRMCEDIEYVELLSLASCVGRGTQPGSVPVSETAHKTAATLGVDVAEMAAMTGEDASLRRLMYVAAYAMSNYSSTLGRVQKPFNPMLGETFELVRQDKGNLRYLSEQVCHHPPISACHCESPEYTFWTEVNVKSKFYGKSLTVQPMGICHVRLPVYTPGSADVQETEHYTWKKVTTNVNNVIVGKLWMDHVGDMVIKNWRTGEECTVTFVSKAGGGWFGSGKKATDNESAGGEITGFAKDRNGTIKWSLSGRWDTELHATPTTGGGAPLPLWKAAPLPATAAANFHFTTFATTLNELTPTLARILPPTDSRLRPDQQAMERGDWDVANKLKEDIELLQRDRRRDLVETFERTGKPSGPDARGIDVGEKWWVPRWFVRELDPDSGEEHWKFDGGYWRERERVVEGDNNAEKRKMDTAAAAWPAYVLDIFGIGEKR
ncbi:Oxysterol-binding protein-domain-containing protein [Fimicolochytrium jonesii]|uniref:Oxysterol-binding protein-domain-containing protein n=1 Tax=Fimicolochytrium jonesii TaxID=1396493 RepID=UPI0022FE29AA|nr:Oxysterol-binding protein-domain-containing protein [Fimicolochytrium jonesii]KAI8817986.1 Oxysterol-binding protein-domain-containing protein [Fimicolochytrium jonesii]